MRGLRSDFIMRRARFFRTNAHVVTDADEATVRLNSKREFKAKIAGTDPHTDVGLRKIDVSGLPFVKIGDPCRLEVGEWMAAIGATWACRSPFPSIWP